MQRQSGFTFIEMAVVLLIIALLAAAILVGNSLIRSANINSVLADAARYSAAFTDFRDKYEALPGDMPTAESFWGTPAGGCPGGTGTLQGEVCNGNGDGTIFNVNNNANFAEVLSEWVELANSGFISGSFYYRPPPGLGGGWIVGDNLPHSDIGNATFMFFYGPGLLGDGLYSDARPYNVHWLAFGNVVANSAIWRPVFTGEEAFAIDKKIDDGRPGTGMLRAARNGTTGGYTPNCHTTASSVTAEYNQSGDEVSCFIMFALSQ